MMPRDPLILTHSIWLYVQQQLYDTFSKNALQKCIQLFCTAEIWVEQDIWKLQLLVILFLKQFPQRLSAILMTQCRVLMAEAGW